MRNVMDDSAAADGGREPQAATSARARERSGSKPHKSLGSFTPPTGCHSLRDLRTATALKAAHSEASTSQPLIMPSGAAALPPAHLMGIDGSPSTSPARRQSQPSTIAPSTGCHSLNHLRALYAKEALRSQSDPGRIISQGSPQRCWVKAPSHLRPSEDRDNNLELQRASSGPVERSRQATVEVPVGALERSRLADGAEVLSLERSRQGAEVGLESVPEFEMQPDSCLGTPLETFLEGSCGASEMPGAVQRRQHFEQQQQQDEGRPPQSSPQKTDGHSYKLHDAAPHSTQGSSAPRFNSPTLSRPSPSRPIPTRSPSPLGAPPAQGSPAALRPDGAMLSSGWRPEGEGTVFSRAASLGQRRAPKPPLDASRGRGDSPARLALDCAASRKLRNSASLGRMEGNHGGNPALEQGSARVQSRQREGAGGAGGADGAGGAEPALSLEEAWDCGDAFQKQRSSKGSRSKHAPGQNQGQARGQAPEQQSSSAAAVTELQSRQLVGCGRSVSLSRGSRAPTATAAGPSGHDPRQGNLICRSVTLTRFPEPGPLKPILVTPERKLERSQSLGRKVRFMDEHDGTRKSQKS